MSYTSYIIEDLRTPEEKKAKAEQKRRKFKEKITEIAERFYAYKRHIPVTIYCLNKMKECDNIVSLSQYISHKEIIDMTNELEAFQKTVEKAASKEDFEGLSGLVSSLQKLTMV